MEKDEGLGSLLKAAVGLAAALGVVLAAAVAINEGKKENK